MKDIQPETNNDQPALGDRSENTLLAWRILAEAEEAFDAKSMACERAACGNWPSPSTIADYLMWLEDEARLQEQQIGSDTPDGREQAAYARALSDLAKELRGLGFEPGPAPWAAAGDALCLSTC